MNGLTSYSDTERTVENTNLCKLAYVDVIWLFFRPLVGLNIIAALINTANRPPSVLMATQNVSATVRHETNSPSLNHMANHGHICQARIHSHARDNKGQEEK